MKNVSGIVIYDLICHFMPFGRMTQLSDVKNLKMNAKLEKCCKSMWCEGQMSKRFSGFLSRLHI